MNLFVHIFALALILVPAVAFGQTDRSFVPLTSIPGFSNAGNSPDITVFLNQLYRLCIGIAAALAVLQIIRAGIGFMTNKGSISENEKARELLQGAVFGLILVLSPIIVFGIINPKILELNFSAERLESETGTTGGELDSDPTGTGTGEGEGDGDGGGEDTEGGTDDEEEEAEVTRGNFLLRIYGRTEPSVTAAAGNCRNKQPPSDLSEVIDKYQPTPIEVRHTGSGQNTQEWNVYCESFSKYFWQYRLLGADEVWSELQYTPTSAARREQFINGCAADGGRLVEDKDLISRACGDSITSQINNPQNLETNCLGVEYQCRKRN